MHRDPYTPFILTHSLVHSKPCKANKNKPVNLAFLKNLLCKTLSIETWSQHADSSALRLQRPGKVLTFVLSWGNTSWLLEFGDNLNNNNKKKKKKDEPRLDFFSLRSILHLLPGS